ncbi:hypothetical protein FH972_022948 [Carpinus fangiana]|uniref:PHD-type domain-containing protein n=1 Tax=Carpinus fangiana TaxID=176857 RepID=A0A5N6KU88_9ROSI|nr:hypothetical protein FH972_022948 [Carpinus fangiana]
MATKEEAPVDYTLNNPDTLTKYKKAAEISHKVLDAVTGAPLLKATVPGAKIVEICQKGDKLLDEEVAKVFKGKKITKGIGHPTTVSPSSYITPYTPLLSDAEEAETELKAGEEIKIQLGAQIDGFGTIVCDTIIVPGAEVTSRQADLILATYYANEVLLRLMVPPGLLASGTDEEKAKAAKDKAPTQSKITQLVEKVAKSYDCNIVESTTCWLFGRNEIEGEKKIILSPAEGVRGDGIPEVGEVWGVEIGVSTGTGKVKTLEKRTTLHRRTTTTYQLKRPSSRATLSEIVKKFSTFPFSLRQLDDERAGKVGVVECVRSGVVRQYEVIGDKDSEPVARLLTTIAITKNGVQLLAAPPKPDLSKFKTDKKITDEEVLKILEQPLSRSTIVLSPRAVLAFTYGVMLQEALWELIGEHCLLTQDRCGAEDNDERRRPQLLHARTAQRHAPRRHTPSPELQPLRNKKNSRKSLGIYHYPIEVAREALPSLRVMASAKDHPHKSSRTPDPLSNHTNGFAYSQHALSNNLFANFPAGWEEPPLRSPQPSFVDNKLERQGVLENMMPLGSTPSAKIKANAKTDPLRRHIQSRGIDASGMDEARSTPEQSAVSDGTRAASFRADGSSRPVTPPTPPAHAVATPDIVSPVRRETAISPARPQVATEAAARPQQSVLGGHVTSHARPTPQLHRTPTQPMPIIIGTPFAKAIMETRRRGQNEQSEALRHLHVATQQDRELADLLTGDGNGNLTPELKKVLRRKIKLVKIEFHRRFPTTPVTMSPQTTMGSAVNNSLARSASKPIDTSIIDTPPLVQNSTISSQNFNSPLRSFATTLSRSDNLHPATAEAIPPTATPGAGSPLKHIPHSRRSSSSLSEVDNEITANPPSASVQDTAFMANPNGKRPAADVDPETEDRRKRARSDLGPPTDYVVAESSIRGAQGGALAPTAPKGPTLRLTSSRNTLDTSAAAVPTQGPADGALLVNPGPTKLGRPRKNKPEPEPRTRPSPAPRVKLSPQKKGRSTVVAGIGRLDGKRPETPQADVEGPPVLDSQSDNNDFCSACSGSGFLLCCDGCERSFHFDCADPPTDPDSHVDEPWFCQLCAGRRNGVTNGLALPNQTGLFGRLHAQLLTRNTTAFVLPRNISTFFEGVKMGPDGEYQLAIPAMPKNWKRKTGYNEDGSRNNTLVQLFSDKAEMKPILCSACGMSSNGNREMVQCDICPLAWHTDCMNPPMANAPRQKAPWHCPAHATHSISSIDPLRHHKIRDEGIPPSHRVRRPRVPHVVDAPFMRGLRNNGLIEIQDDDINVPEEMDWVRDDQNTQGVIHKLPAYGIVADFIHKAKSDQMIQREQQEMEKRRLERYTTNMKARTTYQLSRQLNQHSLVDRRTALNLLQLKRGTAGFDDLTGDGLMNLAWSLEAEAPDDIVADPQYEVVSKEAAAASERKQLELMQALIKRRLEQIEG